MSAITYEEVNLMLRLYDMRREARLRTARSWFLDHFHPVSPDEMMEKYGAWGEKNMYGRKFMGVLRITYIVDEDGKIAHAFGKVKTDTHSQDARGGTLPNLPVSLKWARRVPIGLL